MEQLEASTGQQLDHHLPLFNLPSKILCKVINVELSVSIFFFWSGVVNFISFPPVFRVTVLLSVAFHPVVCLITLALECRRKLIQMMFLKLCRCICSFFHLCNVWALHCFSKIFSWSKKVGNNLQIS